MIFALLVACVAIILLTPVRVDLEVGIAPEASQPSVGVEVRWLAFTWRSGKARPPVERARHRGSRRSAGKPGLRRVFALLGTPGFPARMFRLAAEVLRVLTPRRVVGWVRFGLVDPVSTGVLFGVGHAFAVAESTTCQLRLEPEFAGPALAGHTRFMWAVRPGAVLWPVGTFVLSPVTWRATFAALRVK